jgi:hypothetical protein
MTAGGLYEGAGVLGDDIQVTDGGPENIAQATNGIAMIEYAAIADAEHLINWLCWSYDSSQFTGRIWIQFGKANVFDVDVTMGSADFLPIFLRAPPNTRVRVRLGAAGGGITGKLNVGHRVERPIG